MRQSVPPKPLTILLGLFSRKFGYNTPNPSASPLRAKVITVTTRPKNAKRSHGISSDQQEKIISVSVTAREQTHASQYFVLTTLTKPMGAMPTIHKRRPSRENWGKTNRVVTVARLSEQAPRLRYEIRLIQNGLLNCCVK